MAYVLFSLWSHLLIYRPMLAIRSATLILFPLFLPPAALKVIGFWTGGSYIKCGLSVGWAIKSAISVFILGFREARRETPPQFILRKSPSQHFRTHSTIF